MQIITIPRLQFQNLMIEVRCSKNLIGIDLKKVTKNMFMRAPFMESLKRVIFILLRLSSNIKANFEAILSRWHYNTRVSLENIVFYKNPLFANYQNENEPKGKRASKL